MNRIAYAGAKLGIGNYGVEGLESFVRASNQVNVALKEDLGDEALTALSKITQVMGLIPQMGVEQAMLKTGSAIFKLASNSTATSGKIIDFSNRMLSLGKNAALSTADILALGAAVDSMALEPEVAATAFGKLVTEIRKGTGSIEKDLGLAAGSLKKMVETGKGMDAILTIFKAMHDKGNVFALNGLFKDMGSDGARLVKTMVTMADKVEMLSDAVGTANEAFIQGASITNEYKIQQQTAQGILERANNMWQKAFVNPEGVNAVKEVAQTWYDFTRSMTQSSEARNSIMTTFKILVESCKLLISLLPTITGFLIGKGFAIAAQGIWGVVTAIRAWIVANEALSISFGNVVGIVAGAAGLLYSFFSEWSQRQEDATQANYKFTKSLSEAYKEVGKARAELDNYKRAITSANEGTQERTAAINNFNNKFGSYLSNLLTEKSTAEDLAKAYNEAAGAIKRKVMAQMKERDIEKYVAPKVGRESQLLYDFDKDAKKMGIGFTGTNLESFVTDQVAAGKKPDQIINELIRRSGIGKNYNGQYRTALINSVATTNGAPSDSFHWTYTSEGEGRFDGMKISKNSKYTEKEKLTAQAVAYIRQRLAADKAVRDVEDKFSLFPDLQVEETVPGVPVGDGDSKDKDREAKQRLARQRKEWREQLSEAQSDANAIIDKIKNYYERQILEVTEKANSLNLDEAQTEALTRPIRAKMNDALAVARKAISNVEQGWDTFKQTMQDDMIEVMGENGLNESQMLLDQIEKADLKALQEKIRTLSKSLNRPESALMDQIWRNATKNAQANADAERKQREEIQKILLEHNYTGIVDNNTTQQMEKIGAFALDAEQVKTLLGGDEAKAQALLDKRAKEIATMLKNAREQIVDLYTTDVDTEEGRNQFLNLIFKDIDKGDTELKAVLNLYGEDMKAFYFELLKYFDVYTDAQKRKADAVKKDYEFLWKQKGMQKSQDDRTNALKQVNQGTERFREAGQGRDSEAPRSGLMGGSAFMDQFSYNGNIEQSKLEIELLQEKIRWMEQYGATSEQIAEQQAALAEKQDAYILALMQTMKERMDAVYGMFQPIEDFGTAAGEAFATMTEDAEAGRDAFKAAVGDMIKAMMKQTVQMTEEYIKRRMMQKINDKLVSTEIKKSTKEQTKLEEQGADATSAITEAAGQAKVLLTSKVGDEVTKAVATQTQETTATEQAAAVTDVQTEAAKTEANVGLGIAGGAAKTIGSLGWWGIPLIAVITAVLNGLLGFAMGKVSSLFGGGNKSADTAKGPNTKLVSGMLTYDQGNVRDLKPFFDKDGKMYWAEDNSDTANQGINLLTHPTATTINGQPSLVAEQGPELVIGRETTQAMMQNNPALLKALYQYDRHHSGRTAYDRGNLAEFAPSTTVPDASPSGSVTIQRDPEMLALMTALLQRLNEPISAKIDMYGRGNLYDSMQKANTFMKNK